MKYSFIHHHQTCYPLKLLCTCLEVSTSGFFQWKKRTPSSRKREDERLKIMIREVWEQSRKLYGWPRIQAALAHQGELIGTKRLLRLMREMGICGRFRRKKVRTTWVDKQARKAPNHLDRNFDVDAPNKVWAGDITAIRTRQGWLYLAVVIDLYSRQVVGWAMEDTMEQELCLNALDMALKHRRPPKQLLFHSDQGCQYTSHAYQRRLEECEIQGSMSRRGQCWDNAVVESFFGSLKRECVNEKIYDSHDQAQTELFDYMEIFYNRQRLHSYLNYQTPMDFESNMRQVA